MANNDLSQVIDKLITDKTYAAKLDSDPIGTLQELGVDLDPAAKKSLQNFAASKGNLESTNCSVSGYSCS